MSPRRSRGASATHLHPWWKPFSEALAAHGSPEDARSMQAYMKDIAPFFGVKANPRRELFKEHLAEHGPPELLELPAIVRSAFAAPERELHHTAVDLLVKHARKLSPDDLPGIEEIITTKSWWDTVDTLAVHVVGPILKRHPKDVSRWNARWIRSDDMWLNRTAILFQLRWKADTDRALLFANIERHAARREFFIRKAIGWALRALAATDPEAVKAFVQAHALSPLSRREALRKL